MSLIHFHMNARSHDCNCFIVFYFFCQMDECGDLADFDSSPLDISLINFSFKVR